MSWFGLHAPAGTPPQAIARLAAAMKAACSMQVVKERLASAGGEEAYLDTPAFRQFLAQDQVRWTKLVEKVKS